MDWTRQGSVLALFHISCVILDELTAPHHTFLICMGQHLPRTFFLLLLFFGWTSIPFHCSFSRPSSGPKKQKQVVINMALGMELWWVLYPTNGRQGLSKHMWKIEKYWPRTKTWRKYVRLHRIWNPLGHVPWLWHNKVSNTVTILPHPPGLTLFGNLKKPF